MARQPVNDDWFKSLDACYSSLQWLSHPELSQPVEVIANFGCWSSEFLALLWHLDAGDITVVEVDRENLTKPGKKLADVRKWKPASLAGRCVRCIVEDMSNLNEEQLSSESCDLAYCEDTLYNIWLEDNQNFLRRFQRAVNQMARVVRPGGWVIACELMIKDPPHVGDLIDIGPHFLAARLEKVTLNDAPDYAYCYQKPTVLPHVR